MVVSEGPWGDLLRDVASDELQVNLITVPLRSLHQVLTHAVAEGQAPDLAILDSVWIPEFAADGFLRSSTTSTPDWFRNEHERDFLEPIVEANRYEGRTFGVSPFANIAGFWYRRSAVEALGLLPPRTWSELRSVGRAAAENGLPHPIVMTGGSKGGETTAYCLIAFLESNGARVLAPEGVTLDSRATAQALRFLRSLVDDRLMSIDVLGYEWDKPVRLLAEGKAAISFGGSYETRTLAEALDVPLDELWDHVGFMPVPAGPGRRARDRCWDDELRHLPTGASARASDATAAAGSGAGGARPGCARDRTDPGAALGGRPRCAEPAVPRADGGDARARSAETADAALPAGLRAAPIDARGDAHGSARSRGSREAHGRADRSDHGPPRAAASRPGFGTAAVAR